MALSEGGKMLNKIFLRTKIVDSNGILMEQNKYNNFIRISSVFYKQCDKKFSLDF